MRRLRSSIIGAVALLSACEMLPSDERPCSDADCRRTAIIQKVLDEGSDGVSEVRALPDVLEQMATVSAIIDVLPSAAEDLCDLLPHSPTRERCLAVSEHPDLWVVPAPVSGHASRAGPGPATSALKLDDVPGPYVRWTAQPSSCSEEIDPHGCAWLRAREAAVAGDADAAARSCANLRTSSGPVGPWRARCFVMMAEQHASTWGRGRHEQTIALCSGARKWASHCVALAVDDLASRAPAVDMAADDAWAEHHARAVQVSRIWEDPQIGQSLVNRFWARSMAASVERAEGLAGDAVDDVPTAAWTHLRAALAWRLLHRGDPDTQDLAGWVQLFSAAWERRSDRPETDPSESMIELPQPSDLWPEDREGESHLSAVLYLGSSRRTVAADPEIDARICLLEAAARLEPPARALLEEGSTDRDERVRWTATRLIEQIGLQELAATDAE